MTRMTNQTAIRMGETLTEYDNVCDDDEDDNQATSYIDEMSSTYIRQLNNGKMKNCWASRTVNRRE
eukprot:scaffold37773_cov76-Skeletonema_marinoi.AAC.2